MKGRQGMQESKRGRQRCWGDRGTLGSGFVCVMSKVAQGEGDESRMKAGT